MIIKKYKRALENEKESRTYFEDLSDVPTTAQMTAWAAEISKAEAARINKPEVMDVMGPKIKKGS